jgi:hypothetical protein
MGRWGAARTEKSSGWRGLRAGLGAGAEIFTRG